MAVLLNCESSVLPAVIVMPNIWSSCTLPYAARHTAHCLGLSAYVLAEQYQCLILLPAQCYVLIQAVVLVAAL